MKLTIVTFLSLFMFAASAQTRGQLLQDIRQWSDSVREETYSSQANNYSLAQAQDLLEEAHALLAGSRSSSQLLCARAAFGYIPTNTANGMTYGDNVSTITECQRLLPSRGARAMCGKARFGYRHFAISNAATIGDDDFTSINECLQTAPRAGQRVMCSKVRMGYRPVQLTNLSYLGDKVSTVTQCLELLPSPGSSLMCVKLGFGYRALNIVSGRTIGQSTSTLSECHELINQENF